MNVTSDQIIEPIGRIMAKISRMFLTELQSNLAHLDITRSFYPLLLIAATDGKLTQNELAVRLATDKVQVVRIIDYLSSKGYVRREQDSDDRRKYNLVATEKAQKAVPDIIKAIEKTMAKTLKDMPEGKVDELYNLLGTINNNLSSTNS